MFIEITLRPRPLLLVTSLVFRMFGVVQFATLTLQNINLLWIERSSNGEMLVPRAHHRTKNCTPVVQTRLFEVQTQTPFTES